MDLITYRKEIIAIAKENNVAWDVARDMFLANCHNAGMADLPYYEGADLDYAALREQLPQRGTAEYAEMCREFDRKFREM